MSYIGSTPTSQNFTSGTDYFSGTGSQTAFTLTRTVNSVNDIEVVINNVVQQPSTAYTLSGTTITFTSAPSSGTNNIYVRYLATNMQSFTVPANSITRSQLDSNLQAGFQGRNRIINGHMVVDQRNAGAAVNPAVNGTYTLDRWYTSSSQTGKFSIQQNAGSVTPPAGFYKYLGVTSLSSYSITASDRFYIRQVIEGNNIADFNWGSSNAKTVTLSFWVRSSLTGTFGGAFYSDDGSASYPFTYTISATNTWEQKSITVVGPTIGTWQTGNGGGIDIGFGLGVGSDRSGTAGTWLSNFYESATGATSVVGTSGATWYITGIQLEEGTTATSFEREAYSITLQKCQRYYEVSNNGSPYKGTVFSCYNTGDAYAMYRYVVTKRAAPTITVGSGTYNFYSGNASKTVTSLTTQNTFAEYTQLYLQASSLTAGYAGHLDFQTSAPMLQISAEL